MWLCRSLLFCAQRTLCGPMDYNTPGSSIWAFSGKNNGVAAISTSRSSSLPRGQNQSPALQAASLPASVSSVQFSHSVVSDSLQPYELQHARPPCPSPTPGVHSDSRPSSRWCHPAISSSVAPFLSCTQSLRASGSFSMSQLFTCGGQSIGVSASASVLPMNTQDWSP